MVPVRSNSAQSWHRLWLQVGSESESQQHYLQRYKQNANLVEHIIETTPAPPYDPFEDPDDIYAEEAPTKIALSDVAQPQPARSPSLLPIATLAPEVELSAPLSVLLANSPTADFSSANSSTSRNSPTTPPVHLLHATTGWNWTHPNTAGGPVSDPVPYTTGHPPQEPGNHVSYFQPSSW